MKIPLVLTLLYNTLLTHKKESLIEKHFKRFFEKIDFFNQDFDKNLRIGLFLYFFLNN